MANTVTLIQTIPWKFEPLGWTQVKQYRVEFDTPDEDFTVHTTTSGMRAMIVGMEFTAPNATVLHFKSNTTLLIPWTLEAGTKYSDVDISPSTKITKVGENLVMRCETGVIPYLLLMIAEFAEIRST